MAESRLVLSSEWRQRCHCVSDAKHPSRQLFDLAASVMFQWLSTGWLRDPQISGFACRKL